MKDKLSYYNTWAMDDLLTKRYELEKDNSILSENITALNHKDRHTHADSEQLAFWRSQADLNRQHIAKIDSVIDERTEKANEYKQKYNTYLEI